MKKTIMLLFALLLATGMKADETDTLAIDAIYKELLARPGVTQTAVRYTGGWGAGCANFSWLQGEGSGWTVGNRLTLKGVDKAEADRIMQVFRSIMSEPMWPWAKAGPTWGSNVSVCSTG